MLTVGVTGGIACGKSLVGSFLKRRGYPVCESDQLAHEAIEPGEPAYQEIVDAFGSEILDSTGAIDRGLLGKRVFANAVEREKLNAIVHPRVRQAWKAWMADQRARGDAAVVIVPLLYEVGAEREFDVVVCVSAPESEQLARLAGRGLTETEARARIAAQMGVEEKSGRADYTIVNDDSEAVLEEKTWEVMDNILESRNGNEKQ